MTAPRAAATVAAVLGWALLGLTAWQAANTALFLSRATRATGVVEDPAPHPVIRFALPDGTAVRFRQNGLVFRPAGAAVPVAYEPRHPAATARAASFWPLWGTALWLLPAGLGFVLLPRLGFHVAWGRR
jgi:hypothetical protein